MADPFFVLMRVPETKGKTLEEIERDYRVVGLMCTDQQDTTFLANTEFVEESPTRKVDAWMSRRLVRSRGWL